MTAISAVIKKELKQAFPKIKFSVTTSRMDNISVKWELEIGTAATKDAVSEICKKHETVEHHGSNMDDTSWYSGFSVYANPTCTQERKDWAVKATEARNFVGVSWNETHKHFQEADGRDAFHATKQYREYCDNGVTSDLVDKYGQEPNAKRWYYERLAKEAQIEAPVTESEIIKPELVELSQEAIIPVIVEPIAPATLESLASKSKTVEPEIESLTLNSLVTTNRCRIKVTDVRIETVTGQLLDDQDNLVIEYGHPVYVCVRKSEILSLSEQPQPKPQQMTDEDWKTEEVRLETLLLLMKFNPHFTEAEENRVRMELAALRQQLQLEPATITAAALETNLIPFPSPKQSEPQPVAQPQSEGDDFYLQSYQKWVDKLVARGEYGKIKSFDDWYAIAVEVM